MNNKILLEVNGIKYDGFKEVSYSKSIENLSGTFDFTATAEGKFYLPFRGQSDARIVLNDKPLVTGFIERMRWAYDEASHDVSVEGRDKTSDIIDSTITGNVDLKQSNSLKTIIETVVGFIGAKLTVINQVPSIKDFEENEKIVAEVGDNAFEFIEKFCRKRGVLLTADGDSNIIITRAGKTQINAVLVNQVNGYRNNVKNAEIAYDFTERFHKYVVRSQGNPSISEMIGDGEGLASVEGTEGIAIDPDIRASRVMEIQAESTSVDESAKQRAQWEANVRRARSMVYSCEVSSLFANDTEIYEPNKLIRVVDDFSNIDALMLIRSVNYSLTAEGGTSVRLELVQKDSYTLIEKRSVLESKYNKVGEDVLEFTPVENEISGVNI